MFFRYRLVTATSRILVLSKSRSLKSRFHLVPEQRAIAHILGTLDDKIELNRRMNETLEAMARALFKSWFIDFDPVRAKAALRNHSPLEGESAKAPSGITPPLRGSRRGQGRQHADEPGGGQSNASTPNRPSKKPKLSEKAKPTLKASSGIICATNNSPATNSAVNSR